MDSEVRLRRMRPLGAWIFAATVVAIVSIVGIAAIFGGFSLLEFPPFFFFPWIAIPLFFFGLFFFSRFWWGWGWWDPRGYSDLALETLRQRYARGEITRDQFEHMKKDLEA